MASYNMLAAGLCLLIVCASELSLAAPLEEDAEPLTNSLDDYVDEVQTEVISAEQLSSPSTTTTTTPVPVTDPANNTTLTDSVPSSFKITSPIAAVILLNSTTTASQNVTKAANASANSTESSLTTTSSTPTHTDAGEAEGTAPDEDKSSGENEKGPVLIEKKDGEYRFWWSDSTWMSVVIPVSVGLGAALFLICWICCFRWICCRRCGRGRSSFYKKKHPRSPTGPAKKALRDDFRQLRAKDRMKLLAETSDEEF